MFLAFFLSLSRTSGTSGSDKARLRADPEEGRIVMVVRVQAARSVDVTVTDSRAHMTRHCLAELAKRHPLLLSLPLIDLGPTLLQTAQRTFMDSAPSPRGHSRPCPCNGSPGSPTSEEPSGHMDVDDASTESTHTHSSSGEI